jgi:hypothetical protein
LPEVQSAAGVLSVRFVLTENNKYTKLAERECESLELGCREEEVELQRVDREEDAIDSL